MLYFLQRQPPKPNSRAQREESEEDSEEISEEEEETTPYKHTKVMVLSLFHSLWLWVMNADFKLRNCWIF